MATRKKRVRVTPFHAADYLSNKAVIAEYLAAALEDPNPDVFLHAIGMPPRHGESPRLSTTPASVCRARSLLEPRLASTPSES